MMRKLHDCISHILPFDKKFDLLKKSVMLKSQSQSDKSKARL